MNVILLSSWRATQGFEIRHAGQYDYKYAVCVSRLAKVVEEQRRELETAEGEQAAQADAVQALKAELAALKSSHAALSAENGDLRMLAGEAGATVRGTVEPSPSD